MYILFSIYYRIYLNTWGMEVKLQRLFGPFYSQYASGNHSQFDEVFRISKSVEFRCLPHDFLFFAIIPVLKTHSWSLTQTCQKMCCFWYISETFIACRQSFCEFHCAKETDKSGKNKFVKTTLFVGQGEQFKEMTKPHGSKYLLSRYKLSPNCTLSPFREATWIYRENLSSEGKKYREKGVLFTP